MTAADGERIVRLVGHRVGADLPVPLGVTQLRMNGRYRTININVSVFSSTVGGGLACQSH